MRLRLSPAWLWLVCAILTALVLPRPSAAEDRMIVRGNYYRDPSTRVLSPLVTIDVDVPDERFSVGATYLLDAITSASIGAGTQQITGGDTLFTELRHEASVRAGSRIGEWRFGGFFRYSTETDYISRSVGTGASRDVFRRSGTVSANYSYTFDRLFRIRGAMVVPWTSTDDTNLKQVHYLSLGYSHAVTKTLLLLGSVEGALWLGPQDNPYRELLILNGLPESHPLERKRLALVGSARWMVPRARMVIEPHYRYYVDDWNIHAHVADLRLHFRVLRDLSLRLRYRFYAQSQSFFWRDDGIYGPDEDDYRSADPKMDDWHSHTPGLELTYRLDGLARFKGLHWLAGGWIEASYNQLVYVFDAPPAPYCGTDRRVCPARIGSLAFSLAF